MFVIFALLVAGVGGYLAVSYQAKKEANIIQTPSVQEAVAEPASESLGSEAFEQANNPLKGEALEANPFKEIENPFSDAYKNPFE